VHIVIRDNLGHNFSGGLMEFNATFINIVAISWRPIPCETHRPVASLWQIISHKVVSSTSRLERDSSSQL